MSSSLEEKNRLSLCDIIMPCIYIRSLLIYGYRIDALGRSFREYLHLYCPQAFQRIVYDQNHPQDGRIEDDDNEERRVVFSSESRTTESITRYLDDESSIEDLFPYQIIPTETSPLLFLHQIHFADGTILAFGCHHSFSDGHGFSLLGERFSLWLKGLKPALFDHDRTKLRCLSSSSRIQFKHVEMSLIEPIYSLADHFSTKTISLLHGCHK